MTKALCLVLFLVGCAYPQTSTVLVHDYIFKNAEKACSNHRGLHYVYASVTIKEKGRERVNEYNYPCEELHKFRCQDGALIGFQTGVGFCFISEMQRKETEKGE